MAAYRTERPQPRSGANGFPSSLTGSECVAALFDIYRRATLQSPLPFNAEAAADLGSE